MRGDGPFEKRDRLVVAPLPIQNLPHDVAALRLCRVDLEGALGAPFGILEGRRPAMISLDLRGEIYGDRQHGMCVRVGCILADGALERGHCLRPFSRIEVPVAEHEVLVGHGRTCRRKRGLGECPALDIRDGRIEGGDDQRAHLACPREQVVASGFVAVGPADMPRLGIGELDARGTGRPPVRRSPRR